MKGLFASVGYPTTTILYDSTPRCLGVSKSAYWKLWNLAMEGITRFAIMPLKVATYVRLGVAVLSAICAAEVMVKTLIIGNPVAEYPSVMTVGGVQLIFLGVIGEYLGRMSDEARQRPLYLLEPYGRRDVKVLV